MVNDGTVYTQGNSATQLTVKNTTGNNILVVNASAGTVSVGLGSTASTTAVCSSLANTVAPTAGTAYELRDCSGAPVADYAENYPVAAGVDYGDVVSVGTKLVDTYDVSDADNGVVDWTKVKGQVTELVKTTSAYQGNAIGIVSKNNNNFSSTGYNIKQADNPLPVALNGRVPVKVTNENGMILPGDYLTTSATRPGYAMKATNAGYVIGQALAPFSSATPGQVMVFVKNFYYPGPTAMQQLQDGTIGTLVVTGTLTVHDLTVTGTATITTLRVTGDTSVQKLTINGKVITGGTVPTVVIGLAAGDTLTATATVTGNDTAGTVTFTTGATGTAAGQVLGAVTFTSPYNQAPVVTVSPTTEDSASIRYFLIKTTTGWSIKVLDTPVAGKTYSFDYHVIQ